MIIPDEVKILTKREVNDNVSGIHNDEESLEGKTCSKCGLDFISNYRIPYAYFINRDWEGLRRGNYYHADCLVEIIENQLGIENKIELEVIVE